MINIFGKILAAGILTELLVIQAGDDDGIDDYVKLQPANETKCAGCCKQCQCSKQTIDDNDI